MGVPAALGVTVLLAVTVACTGTDPIGPDSPGTAEQPAPGTSEYDLPLPPAPYRRDANWTLTRPTSLINDQRPSRLAVDSVGNLYVAYQNDVRWWSHAVIVKYDESGTPLLEIGEEEALGTGPNAIRCMVAGDAGNLYVLDDRSRVRIFDSAGVGVLDWMVTEPTARDIGVDDEGVVYVSYYVTRTVRKYDAQGVLLDEWRVDCRPSTMVVDGAGGVYLGSGGAGSVLKYDTHGTYLREFDCPVEDWLSGPQIIGVDGAGRVYTQDFLKSHMYDACGKFLAYWDPLGGCFRSQCVGRTGTIYALSHSCGSYVSGCAAYAECQVSVLKYLPTD